MREPFFKAGQTDLLQRPGDAGRQLGPAQAQLLRTEGDILPYGRTEQLIVRVLKQQAHLRANRFQMRRGYRSPENVHGGRRGRAFRQEAVEVQEQRGLARPVGPDQSHPFAFRDGEAHVLQGGGAIRVAVTETPNLQGVHVFHPRAHMAA